MLQRGRVRSAASCSAAAKLGIPSQRRLPKGAIHRAIHKATSACSGPPRVASHCTAGSRAETSSGGRLCPLPVSCCCAEQGMGLSEAEFRRRSQEGLPMDLCAPESQERQKHSLLLFWGIPSCHLVASHMLPPSGGDGAQQSFTEPLEPNS